MNNAPAILRSLITFALIIPLAVVIGYMLANQWDYSILAVFGILLLALFFPLLLRWHYPLMLLSWYSSAYAFFLMGAPSFSLVMIALSLGISVTEQILSQNKQFIRVPQIVWPLVFLIGVVVFTAKMTGGLGFHAFGSEVYGGKKYVFLIIAILGYFALTARRIPPQRVGLYLGLYLLGGVTMCIGDLYAVTPSWLYFIFWVFPPQLYQEGVEIGTTRLFGVSFAAGAILFYMMARIGIREIFMAGKPWRTAAALLLLAVSFLGGSRSILLWIVLTFSIQFYLEGLHRTRALLVFMMAGIVMTILIIPFASQLPFTFQRELTLLPLNLSVEARNAAEGSSEWRLAMWKSLLPQVPQHLLVGKGYAISMDDFQMMGSDAAFNAVDPSQQGLALSSDFHNGPLSVILPFGIWGAIGVIWFLAAASWALVRNYRYGDPSLRIINIFLLANFVTHLVVFFFVFGGLASDMAGFVGSVGMSVALNGGVCRPAPQFVRTKQPFSPAKFLPRPRPVFQR